MSGMEGPAVEALHAEPKGPERCFSADIGRADSAVRIFHHEVQTAVGRDRRATSCRGVVDRSQGQRSEKIAGISFSTGCEIFLHSRLFKKKKGTINARPSVRSVQGHMLNAGPYVQGRARST